MQLYKINLPIYLYSEGNIKWIILLQLSKSVLGKNVPDLFCYVILPEHCAAHSSSLLLLDTEYNQSWKQLFLSLHFLSGLLAGCYFQYLNKILES